MMLILYIILLFPTEVKQQWARLMLPDEQILTYNILINEFDDFIIDGYLYSEILQISAFSYGVWSRYNPLTQITQIGRIGIFDSSCYNIHNVVNKKLKNINFLYYDCLDEGNQQITKNIKFRDDQGQDHFYTISIDPNQYESNWYFFSIMIWPHLKQVQMFVMHEQNQIFFREVQIKFPYFEQKLNLVFGGGADGFYFSEQIQFSYFPGLMVTQVPDYKDIDPQINLAWTYTFENPCKLHQDIKFLDQILFKKGDIYKFPMKEANENYFLLVGWIKIQQIVQVDRDFTYKLLKLTTKSRNSRFTDNNLSPFCLYYHISEEGNQIIYTTYSYSFPSVNMDFKSNPYLIKEIFDLSNNIQIWQYITVELQNNLLSVRIVFYDEFHSTYERNVQVIQFQSIVFEFQLGNLLQRYDNYFNFFANQFKFSNCNQITFFQECHSSCFECDGPTNSDCLSCSLDSNRIYLPQLKQCVCPYNTVDKIECLTYQDYKFNILHENTNNEITCPFGQFINEYQECFQCPSVISDSQITCLECLNNPNKWINMLYCYSSLVSQKGTNFKLIRQEIQYFTFAGDELHYCEYCQSNCLDEYCIQDNLNSFYQTQLQFCNSDMNINCFKCNIENCLICGISKDQQFICLKCVYIFSQYQNGKCVNHGEVFIECLDNCASCREKDFCEFCLRSYYLIHDRSECRLCNIPNCQYCFEFQINDRRASTLYNDFQPFDDDENIRVGCSQCVEGFNYDFQQEKCVQEESIIQNCLSFYTEISGQELCLLSDINDFSVAPQIINCQQYITNCEQCLLTPNQLLQCVICEQGYSASYMTGQCHLCNVENSLLCLDGSIKNDYWVQLIQSFMMQFLPDNYIYGFHTYREVIVTGALSCKKGYRLSSLALCLKDCDDGCLSCVESYNNIRVPFFFCETCPISYYGFPLLSVNMGDCLICPPLCLTCIERTAEEISKFNPYFKSTVQNIKYTYQCLQAIPDINIIIDSNINVAKYCFDGKCNTIFEYEINTQEYFSFAILEIESSMYYENNLDIDYCNSMGIQAFKLTLKIQKNYFSQIRQIPIFLKESIFSLQQTILLFYGDLRLDSIISSSFIFLQFDIVKWQNIKYFAEPGMTLVIQNRGIPVDLTFIDVIFTGKSVFQTFIQNANYKNLKIKNVTLIDLELKDMIWLEFQTNTEQATIFIEELTIYNCLFENVTLFQIENYAGTIQLNNISIIKSKLIQTVFLSFNQTTQQIGNNIIDEFQINDCIFQSSTLVIQINTYQMKINKLQLYNSQFVNSVLLVTDCNAIITESKINQIDLLFSLFFRAVILTSNLNYRSYQFSNIYINQSLFEQSSLFYIHSLVNEAQINIFFSSIWHSSLKSSNSDAIIYLYDIKCTQLFIIDIEIINSVNISYFSVYQTQLIKFNDIVFKNIKQEYKLKSINECNTNEKVTSQLLRIQGFQKITLMNLQFINLYSVDSSLLQIFTDLLFQNKGGGSVDIQSIIFFGNILIKQNLGNIFSLLVLYFDYSQTILIKDIQFEENFFNQLVDDPSKTAAGLIYVNTYLSTIKLEEIKCIFNGLFNSQYSFLMINSLIQNYKDFNFQNINSLGENIFKKYYNFSLEFDTFSTRNKLIEQLFTISNIGVFQIITSQISIENATFSNIQAYSRSLFDIATQGDGFIALTNINLNNITAALQQNNQNEGCITISSQNSKLNLKVTNLLIRQVYNRLDSAIFTIYPSKKQNKIYLNLVEAIDCFSLMNQFLFVQFSKESDSYLFVRKLVIKNNEVNFQHFLQQILFPNFNEISKIKSENALLQVQNGNLQFNEIFITGMFISQIFLLSGQENRKILNLQILSVQILFPLSLLSFSQAPDMNSTFIIQNLKIMNVTQITSSHFQNKLENDHFFITYDFGNCVFSIKKLEKTLTQTISDLILYLNNENIQAGSLISLISLSKQSKLKMNNILIFNNYCNFCFDGLIFIHQNQVFNMLIDELRCYNNNFQQYGCLTLKAENQTLQNFIKIKYSAFVKNQGTSGAGIYSQNVHLKLKNSLFTKNKASENGGALFMKDNSNDFLITKCFIFDNTAQLGGGIYLAGSNHLTQENFDQSISLFNTANLYSNNLVEAPDHLALKMNGMEMKSLISKNKNQDMQNLQIISIPPYQFFKGQSQHTQTLFLPTGQQIKNYMLFDIRSRILKKYINQFTVFFKNSLNEDLIGSDQNECSIFTTVIEEMSLDWSNKTNELIDKMFYNNQFNYVDLIDLKVSHNPYNDSILQITIKCIAQTKSLGYQIYAKTLKCQQGEFFTNNQCKICEPAYGFYSVTFNATKCSIFDETKFTNITQNEIKLKNGFWRPKFTSNIVEICFKKIEQCVGGWGVGNDLCSTGYIGGQCEECDIHNIRGNGQYSQSGPNSCNICTNTSYQYIPFAFLITWSFISLLLSLKSNRQTSKTFARLRATTTLYEILFKLQQNFESILFKMFFNYLWIFSVIFTFNISFDFSFKAVDSLSTPSASVVTNLDCLLSKISNIELIYLRVIFTIVFFIIQILIVTCGIKLFSLLTKTHFELSFITNAFLYLFVTNQAALIKSLSSLIAVRTISEENFIQGNVSKLFYKEDHLKWIYYFILPCLLIIGVIIPLILFFILLLKRNQLNQVNFREHLGYLFNDYNKQNQFWEQTRLVVRTIIIIFLTSFETSINLKACLIGLTIIFYQILALKRKPYTHNNLNILDIESGQIVLVSILLAYIKYVCEQQNNLGPSKLLQIILVILLIVLCLSFIIRILSLYSKKYFLFFLNFINNISQSYCKAFFFTIYFQRKLNSKLFRKQQTDKYYQKLRQFINKDKNSTKSYFNQPFSPTNECRGLQLFMSSSHNH